MDDVSIAERIRGRTFATGANEPFLLDDPASLYSVERGHLDVFAVETEDGATPVARSPFIARVPEGAVAFGASAEAGEHYRLLAVPSRNAAIVKGRRASIESTEAFDLDATIWIDDWVARLSDHVARSAGPPPREMRPLEAEPGLSYEAGAALGAQHLDVVWVTANRPMRFLGRDDMVIPAGAPPVALTERTWVTLEDDARVTASYTPTIFFMEQIWPALDGFNRLVRKFAEVGRSERLRARRERYEQAVESRQAAAARMFRRLGAALGADAAPEAAVEAARTPLQTAAGLVARSIGATLRIPRGDRDEGGFRGEATRIARRSGFLVRRIALRPGWHRRAGPSFIGLTADRSEPLAVLAGKGGYRAINGATGAAAAVDSRKAAEIADEGLMLYAPTPARIDNGLAALLHALRGHGRDARLALAAAALAGLVALTTPVVTGELLARIVPRVDTPMWIACLGALLVAALGAAAFEIVRALTVLRIESRVDERLSAAVWIRLLALPTAFFRRYTVGDLADRVNGVSQIRAVLTGAVTTAALGGVFSLFSFALLFFYSASLALCAAIPVAVMIAATWVFGRGQMKHLRAAFGLQGAIDGLVFQMISGIAKLRMANAESHALARWAERFAEQKRETLAAHRWMAGQATFNAMFAPATTLIVFAFIQYALLEGGGAESFDLAAFLSFNAAFGQFVAAMTGLAIAWTAAVAAVPLFERVQPILAARPETAADGIDPGDLTGEIEFANVSFRYQPETPNAVDRVSLHIRAGDFVAFVGSSGSGKSTLYRLMLGFERPDSGSVFIDGHDLASLDLPAVRARMGAVLQDGRLSAASIFENIAGAATLSLADAWEAARAAGLGEDIEAMPMGMHTVLPEGGAGLSGGQKQRLLIARMLARKPRIILLDEATSALDNRTQATVQASLKALTATRVVIAHRLSTIQDADRIYVMEAGRIVEIGRYDELMARNGAFARLARGQLV